MNITKEHLNKTIVFHVKVNVRSWKKPVILSGKVTAFGRCGDYVSIDGDTFACDQIVVLDIFDKEHPIHSNITPKMSKDRFKSERLRLEEALKGMN